MNIKNIITVLLVAFILVSCAPTPVAIPTEVIIHTATPAPTLTAIPTSTSVSTNTPAPILMNSGISGEAVYSNIAPSTNTEQIFLKNLDTGYITQLTNSGYNSGDPIWSPDGSKIIYSTWANNNDVQRATPKAHIYIMNKDGSQKKSLLDNSVYEYAVEPDWSPDGRQVVFMSNKDGNDEIYKINLGSQKVDRLTFTPAYEEAFPHWSPDGNSISFASSNDGGPMHIWIMDINGKSIRQVTNSQVNDVDAHPIWCSDSACVVFTRLVPPKLLTLDLSTAEITPLLGDIFNSQDETMINMEGFPSRSPVRGYITFAIFGKFKDAEFYAMDMKTKEIYPLGIEALSLMLYP